MAVELPPMDPVYGKQGPLCVIWGKAAAEAEDTSA